MSSYRGIYEALGLATLGFIFLVLFIMLSVPISTYFDTLEQAANETGDSVYENVHRHIEGNGGLRWLFGFIFVIFEIAAVVRAFIFSISETYEEADEYER